MAGNIKGIIVEIGGDTSGLQKALSKVNSASSSLSKELRGINSLLKLDPKNTELLAQKQVILSKNIETTKDKLNQLKDIQAKALEEGIDKNEKQQENWRALQREIINTQNKLNKFLLEQSGWTTNGRKVEEFGKKIENLGNKLNNIGNKLTSTLTTSILGIGVASGKSAIDFETAFTGVEKTVDGTTEQMNNLKQGIKDMSKQFPTTTTEIAKVAEAAGQLGIQTENILSFSKTMIDMGNSTNLSADEAATSLARFANITQMSQDEFDKLGSAIVDLGNKYATTEAEIIDMSLRLAGAGHQIGMTEGQILGLATALSSVGIEAEMGGSALSKAMVKMQTAVEMGGNKLENVLKKTGMNLRDLELLSANNSMEFKSLADSIGMTSTEVKQLITAGTNLEDFAKISEMTAEEFKNSWKKDATSALTAFIKGLGEAETKGESAITMLSEMGLTEVRLRDSLLRAANAGTLFNDAIKTGTKAWEDNVALTKEANKRYETTASKLKITINKLQDFGIKLGDKLIPIVDKWLDKADKWLDKLDDLDEGTLDNIVSIGLFVAAFGPAIKIIGKLTSTLGTGIKSLGKYTQKIGELDVAAKTTNSSLTKVTSSIGSFAGKASLVVGGTTLIISGLMALDKKINETYHNSKEKTDSLIDSLNDEIESRQNVLKSVNKMLSSNLSEIEHTESLKRELDSLVEANGKVKNGYESRANFILNELNKALETEYSMTGNMIEQYNELSNTIDDLIIKKEAQIILEANEEKYKNVIDKRTEAYKNYNATQNELLKVKRDIEEINKKPYLFEGSRLNDLNEAEKQYKKLASILSSLGNEIKEYDKDIVTYEENTRLALEGGADNYKKIVNSINTTTVALKDGNAKNLRESLKNTQEYIEEQKKYYDIDLKLGIETNRKKYEENIKSGEQQVEQLTQNLIEQTSTIQKLSPDVVSSWVALAQNSREQYNEAISKMPKDMQDKINEITAFVRGDLSVKDAVKQLGEDAVKQLQISDKFEETGKNWIRGVTAGINNKLVRQEALSSMYGFGVDGLNAIKQQAWDEHSPSKETEKAAINLLKGITIGIDKEKEKTINKMLYFGKDLINKFNGIMNYNLNSLEDIPNINASIKRNVNTVLQPKILQPNIVINTQKLDNAEMNRIIDTVNRRFGMQI